MNNFILILSFQSQIVHTMQLNQKENTDPQAGDHKEIPADTGHKTKIEDVSASMSITKNQSSVSQRPSRKAKTKEAVQRHLNRDVELLVDEKQEKKSSTKKDKIATAANALATVTQGVNNGKRSTRSGGQGSVGKASITKANLVNSSAQLVVPMTIARSISPQIDNQAGLPAQTCKNSLFKGADDKMVQPDNSAKSGAKSKKTASLKSKVVITPVLTRNAAKSTYKKVEPEKTNNPEVKAEMNDEQFKTVVSKQTGRKNISNDDEMMEDLSEQLVEDMTEGDQEQHSEEDFANKKRVQKFMSKQELAANRALRIKMGKSGVQAASRRSVKQGKEACQRKLWNLEEDEAIVSLVQKYGTKRWTFIAQMLKEDYKIWGRTGKQCRERWHNHLDPNIKKSPINNEEELIIFDSHKIYGNKWADIAKLLEGRSDNCIKNYYYSTLRKHIRRINKSLKQCQVAKHLNLKIKTLTADILFPLVKEDRIQYKQIKIIDPKKFEDLEHTMRMIFNHEDGQQVTQRGMIAAAQNRIKVEKQLQEMRDRQLQEDNEIKNQKEQRMSSSDEKLLGKRAVAVHKYEQNTNKKQKHSENDDDTDSEDSKQENDEDASSYTQIDEDSYHNFKPNAFDDKQGSQQSQNDNKDNASDTTPKNQGQKSKSNTPLKKEQSGKKQTDQQKQSIQFPKGLQMKPPIAKKSLKHDGSKLNLSQKGLFDSQQSAKGQARQFEGSLIGQQAGSNSYKIGSSGAVTGEVTKRNASNQSQNSDKQETLHDSKIYKNKKDKKKKKNKDKRSGDKHKKKLLFPFYSMNQSVVDDVVAQYDFYQSHMPGSSKFPHQQDPIAVTGTKSGSKIYPGFYDHQQPSKGKGSSKEIMSGLYGGPQMPHTCFTQGGHQNFPMPFPGFMFHPAYLGQFMPFGGAPQQSMEMMMSNPYFKQFMKNGGNPKTSKSEGGAKQDKESKQNSSEKKEKDKDQNEDEAEKKFKTEKEKAEEYMAEMMNHYFQMPPAMQAYYHKASGFPFPFGMPPHPAFFHQMPMPGQINPSAAPHRDKHHSSAYHKQFTMPITPNNLQSQVFGGEKQYFSENSKQNIKKGQAESGNLTEIEKKDEQINSRAERQQSSNQPSNQTSNQPQYNSNITVMINQYGHFQNRPDMTGHQEGVNADSKKTQAEQFAQDAIQNLISSKQSSFKKVDLSGAQHKPNGITELHGGTTSATFKQQFKPQSIGTLNFQSKLHQQLNSKGVTPSNQQAPLMSTSNFLFNNQNMIGLMNQQMQTQNNQGQPKNETSLQHRLFAGTPKLFIGNVGNQQNSNRKMPTSTTAAAAAAFLQQNGVEPLQSTKNLYSKETFNGNVSFTGPKLNTKTHAQYMNEKKQANQLITPKVNTLGQDPEAYRKNLEKMFMNINQQQEANNNNDELLSAHGGAFTQKRQTSSRENSQKKNSVDSGKQDTNQKSDNQKAESKQEPAGKQSDREGVGMFMIPQAQDTQNLALNNENLSSLYGAEVCSQATKQNNNKLILQQLSKNTFVPEEVAEESEQPLTPNLGLAYQESLMNQTVKSGIEKDQSNAKDDRKEDVQMKAQNNDEQSHASEFINYLKT